MKTQPTLAPDTYQPDELGAVMWPLRRRRPAPPQLVRQPRPGRPSLPLRLEKPPYLFSEKLRPHLQFPRRFWPLRVGAHEIGGFVVHFVVRFVVHFCCPCCPSVPSFAPNISPQNPLSTHIKENPRTRMFAGLRGRVYRAEGVGFEPTVGLTQRSISSRVP